MARKMERSAEASSSKQNNDHSVAEMKEWYEKNKQNIENFASAQDSIKTLRDVTKSSTKSIPTINKETLKSYFNNIGSNEKNIRDVIRYLYYRSNILFRLIMWYSGMWDLRCRMVYPPFDLTKGLDTNKAMKSYKETIDMLELMDMQGAMTERLINVYLYDVSYALTYIDDTGMFFYELDPDDCIIDSRYSTKDLGFAIDMSKYRSAQRQKIIEYLGEPLSSMYQEYLRTGVKYIHCPDEYASCFKFDTSTLDIVVSPMIRLALSIANLEDLVDIQATADALSIYKLIYMPMKVISGSKQSDDFQITPDISHRYFQRMLQEDVVPSGIGAAIIPGDELKTIEFDRSADSDTTSVEKASNQILQTAGGGAVINANAITSTAAFEAWLKEETEFALSTLMPQVNGFTNRMLMQNLSNPCKVEHFEVSVYTRELKAKELLESCQYSFANRLAYNTCLGINEKATLAMLHFENEVLGLPDLMKFPLSSSFTSSGKDKVGQIGEGSPKKDVDDLKEDNGQMR